MEEETKAELLENYSFISHLFLLKDSQKRIRAVYIYLLFISTFPHRSEIRVYSCSPLWAALNFGIFLIILAAKAENGTTINRGNENTLMAWSTFPFLCVLVSYLYHSTAVTVFFILLLQLSLPCREEFKHESYLVLYFFPFPSLSCLNVKSEWYKLKRGLTDFLLFIKIFHSLKLIHMNIIE